MPQFIDPEGAARFYQERQIELSTQVGELQQEVAKLKGLIKENATTFATLLREADAATAAQRQRAEGNSRDCERQRQRAEKAELELSRIGSDRVNIGFERQRAGRLEMELGRARENAERLGAELSRVRQAQTDDNTYWAKELEKARARIGMLEPAGPQYSTERELESVKGERDSLRRAYKMACERATKQDEKARELENNLRGKNEAIAHRDEKLRQRGDELTRLRTMLGNFQRVTGFAEDQVRDAAQAGMGMYRTHPGSPVFRAPTEVVGKAGEAGAFIPYGTPVINKGSPRGTTGYKVVGFDHRGVLAEWGFENIHE